MTFNHIKNTMASLLEDTMAVSTYQLDLEGTSFIWKVTEVGGEKQIIASTNADQVPFPTLGAYSGDRKESKYGKTMMTEHYDACYRSFFGHGASQNPKKEAAAILNVREPRSPFFIPPPVSTGNVAPPLVPNASKVPVLGIPPADLLGSSASVPPVATITQPNVQPATNTTIITKQGSTSAVDPTVAAFWNNIQATASSLQPGAALFDIPGEHTMTPAKAQLQLEYLELTAVDVQGLLMTCSQTVDVQMQNNVKAVSQAVKGSLQSWTKGKMHASISGVQNAVLGYDYHAVFSFILTQASLFYGKVGNFKVVAAG